MKKDFKYYIVEGSALPEVFLKVIEVNNLLQSGKYKNISDATDKVGISRSAYYKYKDKISPFNQLVTDSVVTFSCSMADKAGVLSHILSNFAKCGANILTINQNIPTNGVAVVIISARTSEMKYPIETLIKKGLLIDGVLKFEILSSR